MTRSASTAVAIAKITACGQRPRNFSITGIAVAWAERRSTITTSGGVLCAACSSIGRTDTAPDRRRRATAITNSWSSLTISPLSCAIVFRLPLVPLTRGSLGELSLIRRFRRAQPIGRRVDLLLSQLQQASLTLGFFGLLLRLGFPFLGVFLIGLGLPLRLFGVALGLFLGQLFGELLFLLQRLGLALLIGRTQLNVGRLRRGLCVGLFLLLGGSLRRSSLLRGGSLLRVDSLRRGQRGLLACVERLARRSPHRRRRCPVS